MSGNQRRAGDGKRAVSSGPVLSWLPLVGTSCLLAVGGLDAQSLPVGVTLTTATFTGDKTSHGEPVIADLGLTPGHKQIIFGTYNHKLYVVNYNGTVAPGFPVTLPADVYSSAAIGDIDGNGIPDIVVGYGSTLDTQNPGGLCAFRRDGGRIWCRVSGDFGGGPGGAPDGIPDPVMSTPAIGDVDGDGRAEVAWGSLDATVYLVDGATGTNKPGWPRFVRDTVFSSPALADIDGDGKLETVIGVDADLEGAPYNTPNGGCLHVFRYDGTELAGFPQCVNQVVTSSPAIGDINGDTKPEIVVGTGSYPPYDPSATHAVYAFKCDGSQAAGWPVPVDGQVATSPALGDIDGDGIPDVVVTDNNVSPSTTFHVYGFKGNGTRLFKSQPKSYFGTTPNAGSARIADILGDSSPEIIVPVNTELCILSKSGTQLSDDGTHFAGSFSFFADTAVNGVAVGDVDNDGVTNEIVAVSAYPFPSATDTKVFVWTVTTNTTPKWGFFKESPARLSTLPGTPSCQIPVLAKFYALTPCRIADTRYASGPYAAAPSLPAQSTRNLVIAGQCGIPSDAKSVSLNLTVIPRTAGQMKVYPAGQQATSATSISFPAGRVLGNNLLAKLGTGGAITVQNEESAGSADIVIDTNGYFK